MLKFALKVLLFIIPLLILFAALEYNARSLPSNFEIKREILEQNLDRAEIIVAGSSHTYLGINPKSLGKPAVSIAYPAQDIYYDSKILNKYLPQAKSVKLVIITVSYISFEYMLKDSPAHDQVNFYKHFWEIPRQNSDFKLADYSAVALFGLQRSRDFLLTGSTSDRDKIDDSGGNADLMKTDKFDILNGQIAVKRHEAGMKEKYIDENREYLNELLKTLKDLNIQTVIITTPCFSTYYDNINPERYLRMQNEVKSLSQKYGVEYRNYFRDERFTAEDFLDSDHLNTKGAVKFTAILKNEIINEYF